METKEVKCDNCGKYIYVLEDRIKEKMFCTLGCMNISKERPVCTSGDIVNATRKISHFNRGY